MCSITATVYYGGLCTQKYISDPVTVSSEIVPLKSLPPLKWSICKPVTLTDCTISYIFSEGYYRDYYTDDYTENYTDNYTDDYTNDYTDTYMDDFIKGIVK